MTLSDRIFRFDGWIIDRLLQPLVDRLPEGITAFQVGMSCQLGALLLQGLSFLLLMLTLGASFSEEVDAVLVWFVGLAFLLGLQRFRQVVRPGQPNPLRVLLRPFRLISIPFLIYALIQDAGVAESYWMAAQLGSLSEIVFVLGLYLISCQPKPPYFRRRASKEGKIIEGAWSPSSGG